MLTSFFSRLMVISILTVASLHSQEIVLTPPSLDAKNIAEQVICIRPNRKGIFRLETETSKNQQLIIHNYGQGGAGWTYLPGSVNRSLNLLKEQLKQNTELSKTKEAVVVGAGCNGLLTAIRLKQTGYNVTIIAEHTEKLASYNAGGLFNILISSINEKDKDIVLEIALDSFKYYKQLAQSTHPEFVGVSFLPLYDVTLDPTGLGYYFLAEQALIPPPEEVIISFNQSAKYRAKKFKAIFMNTNLLMNEFWKKIRSFDIPIIRKKITSFSEIQSSIIFNCTGIGASELGDTQMIPTQGHLFLLKDEPLEKLQYIVSATPEKQGSVYWIPKGGGVLGGTWIEGENKLDSNQQEFKKLMERAKLFFGLSP